MMQFRIKNFGVNMRRVPTTFGVSLLNAAVKSPDNWMAKQIKERATNTMQGTKAQPSVTVRVSTKTREKIAREQGILV